MFSKKMPFRLSVHCIYYGVKIKDCFLTGDFANVGWNRSNGSPGFRQTSSRAQTPYSHIPGPPPTIAPKTTSIVLYQSDLNQIVRT